MHITPAYKNLILFFSVLRENFDKYIIYFSSVKVVAAKAEKPIKNSVFTCCNDNITIKRYSDTEFLELDFNFFFFFFFY